MAIAPAPCGTFAALTPFRCGTVTGRAAATDRFWSSTVAIPRCLPTPVRFTRVHATIRACPSRKPGANWRIAHPPTERRTIMVNSATAVRQNHPSEQPLSDWNALKTRQHAAWSSGDYGLIGITLQIVGEQLCEALDLRSGKTLDVPRKQQRHARRRATLLRVTSTDYVPSLLERGRSAPADGLRSRFKVADAEALPFSRSRSTGVSTFGVMFTPTSTGLLPNSRAFASPAARLGSPLDAGRLVGRAHARQVFAAAGRAKSPALWGTRNWLIETFGPVAASISPSRATSISATARRSISSTSSRPTRPDAESI